MNTLFATGYGSWPPAERMAGLIGGLRNAGVKLLVDICHSPCSAHLAQRARVSGGVRAHVVPGQLRNAFLHVILTDSTCRIDLDGVDLVQARPNWGGFCASFDTGTASWKMPAFGF